MITAHNILKLLHLHSHHWSPYFGEDRGVGSHHASGIVLQVDGQCCLHSTSSWHHRLGLQDPLDHTQGVMQGALHLVTHEVVGPAQNDWSTRTRFGAERKYKKELGKEHCHGWPPWTAPNPSPSIVSMSISRSSPQMEKCRTCNPSSFSKGCSPIKYFLWI